MSTSFYFLRLDVLPLFVSIASNFPILGVNHFRPGSEMEVQEDEEGDPSDAANDQQKFRLVGERHTADGVPFDSIGRRLSARQAVIVKVRLVIIRRAKVLSLCQSLRHKYDDCVDTKSMAKV